MKREQGYYWVIYDNNEWEIGKWDDKEGYWILFDSWDRYNDDDLDQINETQINPPM